MTYRIILIYGVFIFFLFQHVGQATRFLPMIVWDHMNPLLKCKSNWLTIPKIDIFDQVDFVCPTLKLNVDLLDGYSRPKSEMNANIFQRKVDKNMNMTVLRQHLNDGTFCDPSRSDKLYTCKDGIEGKSLTVVFKNQNSYKTNDTVAFFYNGDGKASTLNSNTNKCTMVFVIKITWNKGEIHDMSYGKWLNPKPDGNCNNISISCNPPPPPCQQKSTCVSSVSISPTPTSITKQQKESSANYFTEKLISFNYPTQSCNCTVTTSHSKIQSTAIEPNENQTRLLSTNTVLINLNRAVKVSSFSLSRNKTILTSTPAVSSPPVSGGRARPNWFNKENFGLGLAVGLFIGIIACCICFCVCRRMR